MAEFAAKQVVLAKVKVAAKEGKCRLIYFDEAGFHAAPPIQYGWSPIGVPHELTPVSRCRRSVLGALDYGQNTLMHYSTAERVTRETVIHFLDQVARNKQENGRFTFVVLDNAAIHHGIDQEIQDRWLTENRMLLVYLPTYSPELNLIEMVWKHAKYYWRRFSAWTKDTLHQEVQNLLNGYGTKYQISFSL